MNRSDINLSQSLPDVATALEEVLDSVYGARCGFVLVVAPIDQERTAVQYALNVERADGKMLLQKLLEHWNAGLPDVPAHQKRRSRRRAVALTESMNIKWTDWRKKKPIEPGHYLVWSPKHGLRLIRDHPSWWNLPARKTGGNQPGPRVRLWAKVCNWGEVANLRRLAQRRGNVP
jgi:hypothetical protein